MRQASLFIASISFTAWLMVICLILACLGLDLWTEVSNNPFFHWITSTFERTSTPKSHHHQCSSAAPQKTIKHETTSKGFLPNDSLFGHLKLSCHNNCTLDKFCYLGSFSITLPCNAWRSLLLGTIFYKKQHIRKTKLNNLTTL